MKRARLIIADDHRLVADGLRSLLEPQHELLEIVADGRELVTAAVRLRPDIIVADISMPRLNGLDAVDQLRRLDCPSKVIFLTMHRDPLYVARALRSGASGFVSKHSASSDLLVAIQTVLSGKTYIPPELAELARHLPPSALDMEVSLTRRQREVLQLFAEGLSAKEVAKTLHISARTAEGHKAQIMGLLGADSTADLVQFAIRYGLIPPP